MRLLADESCDFAVVRALRSAGYDIVAVAEIAPQAEDEVVIDLAAREGRILLTEDKDFGQLVYAGGQERTGVILLRFPAGARTGLPRAVLEIMRRYRERLAGCFVVLQPGRVRIGRSPGD